MKNSGEECGFRRRRQRGGGGDRGERKSFREREYPSP